MNKQPVNLTGMVNLGEEPDTSANANTTPVKSGNQVFQVPNKFFVTDSKQVSVKMSPELYALIRHCNDKTDVSHKDILLEGFEMWVKQHAAKLK